MVEAIICDIDGTLANNKHRLHFLRAKPSNWKAYNEAMCCDTGIEWCIRILNGIAILNINKPDSEKTHILFVTGREGCFRSLTKFQIIKWTSLPLAMFSIFMRETGDYRSDVEVKREIYMEAIKDKYDVLFCLEDRQGVADLWREYNLTCLQCEGF